MVMRSQDHRSFGLLPPLTGRERESARGRERRREEDRRGAGVEVGGEDQREGERGMSEVCSPPSRSLPSTVTPVPFISMRATGACATLKTLDTPPPPTPRPPADKGHVGRINQGLKKRKKKKRKYGFTQEYEECPL